MIELVPVLSILAVAISLMVFGLINLGAGIWLRFEAVFTENTENRLNKLFLFTDSRKLLLVYLLLLFSIPLFIWIFFKSIIYLLGGVGILLFLPRLALRRMELKRRQMISLALPDMLAQVAASMKTGATFTASLTTLVDESNGPLEQEISLFLREIRLGTSLEAALENLGERICSEDVDLVISAALIARDVGGNLSEIFFRLSDSLRQKQEMEQKISALTSQGVLQGWVVSLLPFAIMLALTFIEPVAIRPLWNSLLGWIFLAVILMLQLTGGLMIRKIVSIDI